MVELDRQYVRSVKKIPQKQELLRGGRGWEAEFLEMEASSPQPSR